MSLFFGQLFIFSDSSDFFKQSSKTNVEVSWVFGTIIDLESRLLRIISVFSKLTVSISFTLFCDCNYNISVASDSSGKDFSIFTEVINLGKGMSLRCKQDILMKCRYDI